MNFAEAMKKEATGKLTENGAFAYNTAGNVLIDLFAQIGALRPRDDEEIQVKFLKAYRQCPELATKMLFYAGNIRGGLGERRTFKLCLKALAQYNPQVVIDNIPNIPYYNRFDSLFVLIGTSAEAEMWKYVEKTLLQDMKSAQKNKPISLLAKWMPSEKASSKKTRENYHRALSALKLTPRKYRKMLSYLRSYIDVTECKMSDNNWEEINYSTVPSHAMKNYSTTFTKHDEERFTKYMTDVRVGKEKINASTLFPYDLVKAYFSANKNIDTVVEEQWKALPNYIDGEHNIVVMADVSGSMAGRPMETSIGLAIYFAERNKGAYANTYMTFTSDPHFIRLDPHATLKEKIMDVRRAGVGYSTNLEEAFRKILVTAVNNNVNPGEMPEALVIISDMEIDRYMRGQGIDFIEEMKYIFWDYGYALPTLIIWNVEARQDTYLTQNDDVILISGQSPSVFKSFIGALNGETREDVMIKTLTDPMYDRVITTSC